MHSYPSHVPRTAHIYNAPAATSMQHVTAVQKIKAACNHHELHVDTHNTSHRCAFFFLLIGHTKLFPLLKNILQDDTSKSAKLVNILNYFNQHFKNSVQQF